jgi:hypothetical protein
MFLNVTICKFKRSDKSFAIAISVRVTVNLAQGMLLLARSIERKTINL